MATFIILAYVIHLLPSPVLDMLGQMSDIISDMSPTWIRGIEHVVFKLLLN